MRQYGSNRPIPEERAAVTDRRYACFVSDTPVHASMARPTLLAILFALGGAFVYLAVIQLGYSADGAYMFSRVIESKAFYNPSWSRTWADVLLQAPLLLAVQLGVTRISSLSGWYHFGLVFPFLLSFALCWFARRPVGNDVLLLFPLISYILVSLPGSSILAGESHVLAVMIWPALFLILRPRWSKLDAILLVVLLLLLCRLYEAYLPSAVVLVVLLARRFRLGVPEERKPLVLALGLAVLGLAMAAYGIINPALAFHRQAFLSGLRDTHRHPMLVVSIAAILGLALALAVPRRRFLAVVPLLLGFGSIALPYLGRIATAGVSFNIRSLSGTLLPLLLLSAVLVHFRPVQLPNRSWALAGVTLIALIAGYVSSWSAWRDFRKDFVTTLDAHTGYVPVDETLVGPSSQRWRWTTSLLSVLWSRQCVRSILVSSAPGWYPFDPRDSLPLQNRVRYHDYFLPVSPNADHCR